VRETRRDRRLVFNLGVLGLSQVATQLLNLAALVLVARLLGVEGFGLVQVGVAVSAYALLTADMGLLPLGIREVARMNDTGAVGGYLRIHLGLLGTLALGVMAVAALVLPLAPFYAAAPPVFLLYAAFVFPQVYMLDWLTTGLQQLKWTGAYGVIRSALYAGCVVLVLPHVGSAGLERITWVPLLYVLSFFVADVVLAWHVARSLSPGVLRPRLGPVSAWRHRLGEAAPIGTALIVMRVLLNVDVLILGILTDAPTVGVYAAASKPAVHGRGARPAGARRRRRLGGGNEVHPSGLRRAVRRGGTPLRDARRGVRAAGVGDLLRQRPHREQPPARLPAVGIGRRGERGRAEPLAGAAHGGSGSREGGADRGRAAVAPHRPADARQSALAVVGRAAGHRGGGHRGHDLAGALDAGSAGSGFLGMLGYAVLAGPWLWRWLRHRSAEASS
jgi:hypothetical protein